MDPFAVLVGLKNRNSVIWKSYFMNPIVLLYIFQQAVSFQFECLNPVRWTTPILHQVNDEDAALLDLCTSSTELHQAYRKHPRLPSSGVPLYNLKRDDRSLLINRIHSRLPPISLPQLLHSQQDIPPTTILFSMICAFFLWKKHCSLNIGSSDERSNASHSIASLFIASCSNCIIFLWINWISERCEP